MQQETCFSLDHSAMGLGRLCMADIHITIVDMTCIDYKVGSVQQETCFSLDHSAMGLALCMADIHITIVDMYRL